MGEVFKIRIAARGYEVDSNGHVAGAVLLQYGQHARWECLRAAGVKHEELLRSGVGPVSLEERIRFRHELVAGEEVDASCRFDFGVARRFAFTRSCGVSTAP